MQIGQYDSDSCHPDRSNPIFSSHLTSCEMVGLRSGGTSLLFSSVGARLGGIDLPYHPHRPHPIYSSHLTSCQFVGLRSGRTYILFPRVYQHKSKQIPGFSQTYNTTKLTYFEPFQDVRNAIAREKQLKRWNRSKKIFLIEKQTPPWQDLYPTLIPTPK